MQKQQQVFTHFVEHDDASSFLNEPDFSQDYEGRKIPDLKTIVECLFERVKQQSTRDIRPLDFKRRLLALVYSEHQAFQEKYLKVLRMKQKYPIGKAPNAINRYIDELVQILKATGDYISKLSAAITSEQLQMFNQQPPSTTRTCPVDPPTFSKSSTPKFSVNMRHMNSPNQAYMKAGTSDKKDNTTGKVHKEKSENACVDAFTQTEEQDGNSGSAEYCTSDSDSGECSSDSDSSECCYKCSGCLSIIKRQKLLEEEFESQKERLEGAQSLCEDYKKVLLGGLHHDVILKVGNKELQAHRDILRVRSRVFESMLDHDMKEKNTGIIDVSDCNLNAMELFLSYVYSGKIETLDHNNMLGLYYIADKYEMVELKRECCNFIKKSLSLTNMCSVIQLALKHSDSDLLQHATAYFADNMLDILQTVEWQSFLRDNSTVGNELLIKSIKLKNTQS